MKQRPRHNRLMERLDFTHDWMMIADHRARLARQLAEDEERMALALDRRVRLATLGGRMSTRARDRWRKLHLEPQARAAAAARVAAARANTEYEQAEAAHDKAIEAASRRVQ